MKRAVVFGAGSIGRGFIGASFAAAGWRVTFVDVVGWLVDRLNADGGYHQVVVSDEGERVVRVEPVDALLLDDADAVIDALSTADFAATAVGAANLPPVASLLAKAALRREASSPLNVLLCENMHGAPAAVRELVAAEIGPAPAAGLGLLATSIGRMVPVPLPDEDDPTGVRVEEYAFLPYDAAALMGAEPDVPGLIAVRQDFELFSDRKLYVHNMGHCMLAYLGELRGHEFLWQAVADLDLRYLARNAMVETCTALALRHGVPAAGLLEHVDDLLSRFANRALGDTVERVGRDPERKMQPEDRLLGSYLLCRAAGVEPRHVSIAVALGARRLSSAEGWEHGRVLAFLDEHLFARTTEGREALLAQWSLLEEGAQPARLVQWLDGSFRPSRVV